MLISLSHKFIFVASSKSASTAIEKSLKNFAEVQLTDPKFGKYDNLSKIANKFPWALRIIPAENFFVFGVVREPVDYLLSIYNGHSKPAFDGQKLSTKGLSFDDFLKVWCVDNSKLVAPQHLRFVDTRGRLSISYVSELNNLTKDFPKICAHLGLSKTELKPFKVAPLTFKASDLTAPQLAAVKKMFKDDYDFIAKYSQLPAAK